MLLLLRRNIRGRKVRRSTSCLRRRLLVNWITRTNHTHTSPNRPDELSLISYPVFRWASRNRWIYWKCNKLDALCSELSELRHLLREQVNPESALYDVNAVSSKWSNSSSPTRQGFSCGSTTHLRRQCSRAPPVRGRGRSRGRGDLHPNGPRSQLGRTQNSIACYNCGSRGHIGTYHLSPVRWGDHWWTT